MTRYDKHPFRIWYINHRKGVLFMRKGEKKERGLPQMAAGVLLGGLLALGIELLILLAGAAAVSKGILKEDISLQLTTAACLIGTFLGGVLACGWWPSRKLLAGLGTGALCFVLILVLSLGMNGQLRLGMQGLIELAACLCGGALAGLLCRDGKKKKRASGGRRTQR